MSGSINAPDLLAPWLSHVERALTLAGEAGLSLEAARGPARDLAPALRRIELGMASMYDAYDGRGEPATSLGVAHGRLFDAAIGAAHAGMVGAVASLRDACAALIAAEEQLDASGAGATKKPAGDATSAPPLRASFGAPHVHVVPRKSLVPTFRAPAFRAPRQALVPVAMPAAKTFEELSNTASALAKVAEERRKVLAERLSKVAPPPARRGRQLKKEPPPPGFARAPSPALSEDELVCRWGRECFEEIGMLGVQRAPLPGDEWRSCGVLEGRLLHALDALAALGAVAVAHVEALALDAPAPDPMRVFAAAMIGGSIAGRDALGAAERVLRHFGAGDATVAAAFGAAWRLAPHPLLPGVLRELARSTRRGERALSVSVLAARGWLTATELSELAKEGSAELLVSVLPAMGATRHVELEAVATDGLRHADLRVRLAAIDALTIAGDAGATAAAREVASAKGGEPALVRLALVAREDDALRLVDRLREQVSPEVIEAVGWAGHVSAVPLLIEILETGDDERARAAGVALDRLLGAGITDEIEILPEALEEPAVVDPDPEPREPRRSLAEIVDDARDRAPAGSTETLVVPSVSAERWRRHWAESGGRFDVRGRWRRGHGHCEAVCLQELDRLPLGIEDRRCLQRELAYRTGRFVRLDPHDFVATQEESLREWAVVVAAAGSPPGAW